MAKTPQDCCEFFTEPSWDALPLTEDGAERNRLVPLRFRRDAYYGRHEHADTRGITYQAMGTRLTEHYEELREEET